MANYNMFAPSMQQAQNQIMLVPVQGDGGAQMYPVAAGTTVALIDFDSGTFWLKTTAQNGLPQQMRKFEFKEIVQAPPADTSAVSREEFASLQEKMDKILEALGEGKKE